MLPDIRLQNLWCTGLACSNPARVSLYPLAVYARRGRAPQRAVMEEIFRAAKEGDAGVVSQLLDADPALLETEEGDGTGLWEWLPSTGIWGW